MNNDKKISIQEFYSGKGIYVGLLSRKISLFLPEASRHLSRTKSLFSYISQGLQVCHNSCEPTFELLANACGQITKKRNHLPWSFSFGRRVFPCKNPTDISGMVVALLFFGSGS